MNSFHAGLSTASNSQLQEIVSRPSRTPVACLACRRSKIKCRHEGFPPCRHCLSTKKQCVIPSLVLPEDDSSPAPKRRAPTNQVEGSLPSFKKSKYEAQNGLPVEEVLREAIDVFFQHFYNDIFAFIHRPSFLKTFNERPEDIDPALLLAMLTLSARFCRTVLKDFENESAACEYFCKKTLALLMPNVDSPSIVRIQAFLMIGLHLWGASQGPAAWIYVGIAIRMSQVRDLGSEQSYPTIIPNTATTTSEWIMSEERRRTFWSAYLLDRYLSNGRGRPQAIKNEDITIPLPSDNINFTFGTPESTRYLNQPLPSGETLPECTGTMASMIELVDLWSRMAKWSCSRAWTTDVLAPWDERSEFSQVCSKMELWRRQLPKSLQFHAHTLMIHLSQKSTNYALMWIVYFNGLLFIHRSYLTFTPTKSDPKGPKEAAERGWVEPDGFWKQSAHSCFAAAEEIVSLNETLRSSENTLVTPILLFAVFSAASMLLYLIEFPWVDPEVAPRARTLYETCTSYLKSVQGTWKMVNTWNGTLSKLVEVHHKWATEGARAYQTGDLFSEFRTRVLDFGTLSTTQLDTSYPRTSREMYSSIRTSAAEERASQPLIHLAPVPQLHPLGHNMRNATTSGQYANQFEPIEAQMLTTINDNNLAAFMQMSNWDFLNDDWLAGLASSNDEGFGFIPQTTNIDIQN